MQKILYTIPLYIFIVVTLVLFYFLFIERDPSELPSVMINKQTPYFESISLNKNKKINSKEIFNNNIVVVNFFATWCVPCRLEHAYIEKISKNEKIKVVGINYKDDTFKTKEWLKELGNPYDIIIIDKDGNIGLNWGVYGLPETFIVNKENIITYKQVGPITNKNIDEFYKNILNNLK